MSFLILIIIYTASRPDVLIYIARGERGHTPSRGAPCQYLAGEGPAREAKICLTACERLRRVAVKWLIQKRTSAVMDGS
jgi:hypothetical protein